MRTSRGDFAGVPACPCVSHLGIFDARWPREFPQACLNYPHSSTSGASSSSGSSTGWGISIIELLSNCDRMGTFLYRPVMRFSKKNDFIAC